MATAVSEVDVSQMAAPSLPGPVVSPTTLEEWDDDVIENTVGALIEEQSPLQRMANPRPSQWVWLQPLYGAGATSGTSRDAIGETLVVTLL